MSEELQNQNPAGLAAAANATAPLSQVRTDFKLDLGQYDFRVMKLEIAQSNKGLFVVNGDFKIEGPASAASGPGSTYKRTLYIGKNDDMLAEKPETLLNSGGLRFLKAIAVANKIPTNDQSIVALCNALLGKTFGCAIVDGKPYASKTEVNADGTAKMITNPEFGRNVTPAGTIPARIYREGANGASASQAAAPVVGATFN